MRIACWKIKATNTHKEYVIRLAFPRQQWVTRTLLNVTLIRTLLVLLKIKNFYIKINASEQCNIKKEEIAETEKSGVEGELHKDRQLFDKITCKDG
jgi:hypothetical protein